MRLIVITIALTGLQTTSLFSQVGKISPFNSTDSTVISGKIDGYSSKQEDQLISFYTYDITGRQKKFFAPIQPGGKFQFKLLQQYEGDIGLQYGANFIRIYAKPGEKIEMDIDNNVADKVFHFPGAFKVKGESAEISQHILRFFQVYLPKLDERSSTYNLALSTAEFIEHHHRFLEEDLAFLEKYIQKNDPPPTFRTWARNWLIYEAAGMIAIKPFLGKINKEMTDTLLIQYLKNIPIQNESALHNASYYEFINRVSGGFQMIVNNNTSYRNYGTNPDPKRISIQLIDQYFNGLSRELAYYNLYSFNAHSEMAIAKMEGIWSKLDSGIHDNFIQHALESKRNSSEDNFTPYNLIDRIRQLPVDSLLKNELLDILEKQKGRFVYIDFWGSWCKPCMGEMPYYKDFISALKNEPVAFLFLAVETKPKDMQKVKEKYGIEGEFILLDKNSTDIANEVFGFSGYPSHFLVDPQGNLVTKKLMGVHNTTEIANFVKALIKKHERKTPAR